jgi:hypothetical protein
MLVLVLSTAGCGLFSGFAGVKGSGVESTQERQVGPFTHIDLKGSSDVTVHIGEPLSLTVTTDDNLLDLIETTVVDGVLVIRSKESYSTRTGVDVDIVVPSIEGIEISGSGGISVENLDADTFDARISGSGDILVKGTAERIKAVVTGSGTIDLDRLEAHHATARVDGSGDISLFADESLDAVVAGSGDINYRGKPEDVRTDVRGSGDIRGF